jgi:hypothetical protein
MRKLIPGNLIIILSGLILILLSCTPGSCFEETESFLKVSFYDSTTKKLQAPDSLTIFGINMGTNTLYNKTTKVQPALIPLNSSAESCSFVIIINGINDTLEFRYTNYPHLVSKECGYTFYHVIDTPTFTTNNISYIYLARNLITTINEENLRIFFKYHAGTHL